ncbi:hypothetical protein EZV62_015949 [Acer yangbiense]|uniref:Uncharacterized protein n=1 Tax=Acer yangbiense TaxID=1000413 RepID=A0A5C7HM70_9ROSI|nr:hypothetical protein EZV62_015949 [Acer yangbiense]
MEASNLILYVDQGNCLDELDEIDLETLSCFVEEKRKEISRRIAYCEDGPLSPSSFPLAPPHPPLLAHAYPMFVVDQLAPNMKDNTGESNVNHHVSAQTKLVNWEEWFAELVKNSENMDGSSSKTK